MPGQRTLPGRLARPWLVAVPAALCVLLAGCVLDLGQRDEAAAKPSPKRSFAPLPESSEAADARRACEAFGQDAMRDLVPPPAGTTLQMFPMPAEYGVPTQCRHVLVRGARELVEVMLTVERAANVPLRTRAEIAQAKNGSTAPDPALQKIEAALAGVPDTVSPQRGCAVWAQLSSVAGYVVVNGTTQLVVTDPVEGQYIEVRTCAGPHYAWLEWRGESDAGVRAPATHRMRAHLRQAVAKLPRS